MIRISEGSAETLNLSVLCMQFEHDKRFGCIGYDSNTESVFLMEYESVEDLAEFYGTEVADWLNIDSIGVCETVTDGNGHYYTRIW